MSLADLNVAARRRQRWHAWPLNVIGLLLVVASVGAGWLLQRLVPSAASLGDLLR